MDGCKSSQFNLLRRLTGFERQGLGPWSPQPPCDRTADPGRVPAAGTQIFKLDFAAAPEGIAARLVETETRGKEKRREKSSRQDASETKCEGAHLGVAAVVCGKLTEEPLHGQVSQDDPGQVGGNHSRKYAVPLRNRDHCQQSGSRHVSVNGTHQTCSTANVAPLSIPKQTQPCGQTYRWPGVRMPSDLCL